MNNSSNLAGINVTSYIENEETTSYIILNYKTTDTLTHEKYLQIFDELKEENILINCKFEDNIWIISDKETSKKAKLKFQFEIRKDYNLKLKHFFLMKVGIQKLNPHSTVLQMRKLTSVIYDTNFFAAENISDFRDFLEVMDNVNIYYLFFIKDFLRFSEVENAIEYFKLLDGVPVKNNKNVRQLPCYESVLLFDYIMKDFQKRASIQEKIFYYPLIIWWTISTIIPLRPSEVYRLKRNCIFQKEGKYYIHIDRVKLRNRRKKRKNSIIIDFEIPYQIYELVQDYIFHINEIDESDFLFSYKVLCEISNRQAVSDRARMVAYDMAIIYRKFQKEIIEKKYGYHIVKLGEKKEEKDIEAPRMGDTRCLTIINMIMQGYNPLYIMQMAGHQSLNTQMSYYNHIETFTTAKTYVLAKMVKQNEYLKEQSLHNVSNQNMITKMKLGANFYDLPLVYQNKGRCTDKHFPHNCCIDDCIFCKYFIAEKNMSKDVLDSLYKRNQNEIMILKKELKLMLKDKLVKEPEIDMVSRRISGLINKNIIIASYQYKGELDGKQ